jgi:hypothetical protein
MKITNLRITGLAGGTAQGGWADELKPQDDDCGSGRQRCGIIAWMKSASNHWECEP